jgi:nitrite reductase/ring-hydroxylating ferredoxin subunit
MNRIYVARSAEMREGERRLVDCDGFEIGVYRFDGRFFAYKNQCLHQGGPACEGITIARVVDVIGADSTFLGQRFDESDPHIVCPWHAWEYRLLTGECAGDGSLRLQRYDIEERDGSVYVIVP